MFPFTGVLRESQWTLVFTRHLPITSKIWNNRFNVTYKIIVIFSIQNVSSFYNYILLLLFVIYKIILKTETTNKISFWYARFCSTERWEAIFSLFILRQNSKNISISTSKDLWIWTHTIEPVVKSTFGKCRTDKKEM